MPRRKLPITIKQGDQITPLNLNRIIQAVDGQIKDIYTILGGDEVTRDPNSNNLIIVGGGGSGGVVVGAPTDALYIVLAAHANLSDERVLVVTEGVKKTDGGAGGNLTVKMDINGLIADASPDGAADFVATYDNSGALHKKVLLNNLPGSTSGGGSSFWQDPVIDKDLTGPPV